MEYNYLFATIDYRKFSTSGPVVKESTDFYLTDNHYRKRKVDIRVLPEGNSEGKTARTLNKVQDFFVYRELMSISHHELLLQLRFEQNLESRLYCIHGRKDVEQSTYYYQTDNN